MSASSCRVVVLISGSGSNLQALIDQQSAGTLPIEIAGVISNRPNVQGVERAIRAKIPCIELDHTLFDSRESYDERLLEIIQSFSPDLVVLAGYMRIMSASLVQSLEGKMLNIHPSLLPKYPGLHTHKKVLANGDATHGSSVHFVTEELDGGPVIAQFSFPVHSDDTEASLRQKIKSFEHSLYPKVVGWFAENKLTLENNQLFFDNKPLDQPIVMSEDNY